MLQRAGASTVSAEALLVRMRAKVDCLCKERADLRWLNRDAECREPCFLTSNNVWSSNARTARSPLELPLLSWERERLEARQHRTFLDGRTLEPLPLARETNARGLRCGGARLYRSQSDRA